MGRKAQDALLLETDAGRIALEAGTFAFFIDETGHEAFADPSNPVFGLAACGVPVPLYRTEIHDEWRQIKHTVFSGVERLHAADGRYTPSQMEALSKFFRERRFARIGVTCSAQTELHDDGREAAFELCAGALIKRILKLAGTYRCLRAIAPVVEHSQRGMGLYQRHLRLPNDLVLGSGEHAEVPIETAQFVASKGVVEGLEVADFVAHAAQGTAREMASETHSPTEPRRDFRVVFQEQPALSDFLYIKRASTASPDA